MAYAIGLTPSVTELTSLSTPIQQEHRPQSSFQTKTMKLANGHMRYYGFPVVEWRFPKITVAQRDMLRTFCPDASSEVYIRSSINDFDDTEKLMFCIMEWFEEGNRKAGFRFDMIIKFTVLEIIDEGSL